MNFGDFVKEERYKKLKRALKLNYLKEMELIEAEEEKSINCTTIDRSIATNIYPESIDLVSTESNKHLQTSKSESDVVSSSLNLQKLVKISPTERKPIATSSINEFSMYDVDKDRHIMPPPDLYKAPFACEKNLPHSDLKSNTKDQRYKISELNEKSSNLYTNVSNSTIDLQENSFDYDNYKGRNFFNWRVILNNRGQIIIKGNLEW
jgi:hypothetical protein